MNEPDMSVWDRYVPKGLAHKPSFICEEDWEWELRCGREMILQGRAETKKILSRQREAQEQLEKARAAVRERQRLAAEERIAEEARLEAMRWHFPAGLEAHLRGLAAQEAGGIGKFVVVTDHIDFQGYCYLQLINFESAREVGELLGPNPVFSDLFGIATRYFKAWSILMAYGCEKVGGTEHHVGYGVDGPTFYEILLGFAQQENNLVFPKGSLGDLAQSACRRPGYERLVVDPGRAVGVGDTVGGGTLSRGAGSALRLEDPDGGMFAYPGERLDETDNVSHFSPGCDLLITRLAIAGDEEGGGSQGRRVVASVPAGPGAAWSVLILDAGGDDSILAWTVNGFPRRFEGEKVWLVFQQDLHVEIAVSDRMGGLALRIVRLNGEEHRYFTNEALEILETSGDAVARIFEGGGGRNGVLLPVPEEEQSLLIAEVE